MLSASRNGLFRDTHVVPPFFGFLAGWFSQNWKSADGVVEKLTALPAEDQEVLVLGLWYSGSPESKTVLAKYTPQMPTQGKLISELISSAQPMITEIPLEKGPWVLDALWGNFMSTGREQPVIRIISALAWAKIQGDLPRLVVGGSARWSLISNAAQHPRVLEICRSQIKIQPANVSGKKRGS